MLLVFTMHARGAFFFTVKYLLINEGYVPHSNVVTSWTFGLIIQKIYATKMRGMFYTLTL